jgi:DEAD/DEAH box helicase domain-containing protein
VDIRGVEAEEKLAVVVVGGGQGEDEGMAVLEEVEMSRAALSLYEGGIFLHQGGQYLVRDFWPDRRLARVQRVKVDWTTAQRDRTMVDPLLTEESVVVAAARKADQMSASSKDSKKDAITKADTTLLSAAGMDTLPASAAAAVSWTTTAFYGTVRITQQVFGFFRKDRAGRIVDAIDVDNAPLIRHTKGMWLDVPPRTVAILAQRGLGPQGQPALLQD